MSHLSYLPIVVLCWVATACGDLTRVSAPDLVQPGNLNNPVGAQARRAAAVAQFASAVASQVLSTGLISDELSDRSGQQFESDQRIVNPSTGATDFPYAALTNDRFNALRAVASLEQYSPTPKWHIGELFAYAGYVEIFFAESMCNGIPVATVVNGLPQATPTLTRSAMLALAASHFDSAKAYATGSDSVLNLARVGRGRVLVDSGDFPDASAAVDSVPINFMYLPPFDGQYQTNSVFSTINSSLQASIANVEGKNGLPFVGAADQRVPTVSLGLENGGAGPDTVYGYATYGSLASPMPIASGPEARLIVAEAALRRGDVTVWASTLNLLRRSAITPAMDTLPTDSTTAAVPSLQRSVMFRERAFWLFLTGHRHGDLRRLVRQYALPTESVFPSGLYRGGPSSYGTAVTFIPGNAEQGNPTYTGCLDRLP